MKKHTRRPFPTGALLLSAALAATPLPRAAAQTAGYASQVISYVPGTGVSSAYTANPSDVLGKPNGNVGSGTLNPFSPNYAASTLTGIGMGGELTIELSNFVNVGAAGTREIGVFGNVGLINTGAAGAPAAGNPATAFGVRSVLISVSADGVNFVPLNGGNLLTSTLPANYYTNADTTNVNAPPPANPTLADFGKPFMGSLADFNGETYAQILATLGGSAGGTWLDLSGTGLSRVAFVQFSEPATGGSNGGVFYLNGVSSNAALLGAAVPEPSALALAGVLAALGLAWKVRRRPGRAAWTLLLGGALALSPTARAGLISSVTEGPANAPYAYGLTIEFANSNYYNFVLRSTQATLTGETLLRTVTSLTPGMSVDQQSFGGMGYYVNGITIGADTNPGYNSATMQYWTYWNGTATNPVQWTFANNGESSTTLTPGQADGWVYNDGTNAPQASAFAVPEPGTWALVSLPLAALLLIRVRRGSSPARA